MYIVRPYGTREKDSCEEETRGKGQEAGCEEAGPEEEGAGEEAGPEEEGASEESCPEEEGPSHKKACKEKSTSKEEVFASQQGRRSRRAFLRYNRGRAS